MKNFNKFILGILAVSLAFVSCEDDDKDPLSVHTNDANKSPYVRALVNQNIYLVEEIPNAMFEATIEVPVDNVASYDLAFSLISGSGEYDTIPLTTITSFPTDISYSYSELAGLLGLTAADIAGGDIFNFIGTSTGNDGRVFVADNFSGNVTAQPAQFNGFTFTVLVDCAPITDVETAGTWSVDMQDSYGDGWNGATLVFSVDGSTEAFTVSTAQGTDASHTKDVPAGAVLEIFFTNGDWDSEITFQLFSPDGALYGEYGPSPGKCVN